LIFITFPEPNQTSACSSDKDSLFVSTTNNTITMAPVRRVGLRSCHAADDTISNSSTTNKAFTPVRRAGLRSFRAADDTISNSSTTNKAFTPVRRAGLRSSDISSCSDVTDNDSSFSAIHGSSDDDDDSDDTDSSNHERPFHEPSSDLDIEGDNVIELTRQWNRGAMADSSLGEYARAHRGMVTWYALLSLYFSSDKQAGIMVMILTALFAPNVVR
jgi:hypothetical protein